MDVEQEITALAERVSALESEKNTLQARVDVLEKQGQVVTALKPATPATSLWNALCRRLEKHGIRIGAEDLDEAQGSGSERYTDAGTWPETAGQGITADTAAA